MRTIVLFAFATIFAAPGLRAVLTEDEKQRASELYKQFTASNDDHAARSLIVEEMVEMGSDVAKVIQPIIDPKLCDAARDHCKDMQEKKFFAHNSPVPGKKSPWDRAKKAGTKANSENIYAGSSSGKSANRAWWHSPGHHVNMLAPGARYVGMGLHGKHWTQMFRG